MATVDLLQTFLQIHLASDASAVTYLPYVLQNLNTRILENSAHLTKWNARISSLIHSRESGARWAGLCIARQSALLYELFISQSGQGWIAVVLPMLSRNETLPVLKASIRLILYIFTNATTLPEFQRQVATPNVPKFTQALVQLCQKHTDHELHVLCTDSIAVLIVAYPTLHRPLQPSLSAFVDASVDSITSSSKPASTSIVNNIARLGAVLHLSGGKTGAAGLWRKSVDDVISNCYTAFTDLRSTYGDEVGNSVIDSGDPLEIIPIRLEQLRCSIELLCALLCTSSPRPVPVPLSTLVDISVTMMKSSGDANKGNMHHYDGIRRALENAAIPHILSYSCKLVACLSACARYHIAPHLMRILTVITFHLEQSNSTSSRIPFTKLLPKLLGTTYAPSEPLLAGRLLKALLPTFTALLLPKELQPSSTIGAGDSTPQLGSSNGVGKLSGKNKRNQETVDILGGSKATMHLSKEETELVLSTIDAIPFLLNTPGIPSYLLSLTSRVLVALSITLPAVPLAASSLDASVRDEILTRIRCLCTEGAAFMDSGRGVLARTLPIIAWNTGSSRYASDGNSLLLDLMLHPRLPPLLREVPSVDTLALSYAEEGNEERQAREALGVGVQARPDAVTAHSSVNTDKGQETTVSPPISDTPAVEGGRVLAEVRSSTSLTTPTQPPVSVHSGTPPYTLTSTSASATHAELHQSATVTSHMDGPSGSGQSSSPSVWVPVTQLDAPNPTLSTSANMVSKEAQTRTQDHMLVDDDDDDDIEIPAINMESDTDEE